MGQRTEFTFEVEETILLKQGGKIVPGYCPTCDIDVELVSPDVLTLASGISEREIFRLVEAGSIHFEETDRMLVCSMCIYASFQNTKPRIANP
jgi:hypothetical protein